MIQVDISHLVPAFLMNDRNGYAIAKAIERGLQIFCKVVQDAIDTAIDVDKMPEWMLNELAWEQNIEWWDLDYSLEEKRKTIKDCRNVYLTIGTKAAVETAISAIYPDTKVSEWWEYGGDPFHFKLLLNATYENIDPKKHSRVLQKLDCYKNLRSVLDDIEYFDAGATSMHYVGAEALACEVIDGATAYKY